VVTSVEPTVGSIRRREWQKYRDDLLGNVMEWKVRSRRSSSQAASERKPNSIRVVDERWFERIRGVVDECGSHFLPFEAA
jgi:hypothetical protein